ncbi:hypothetical protein [Novosphingobium acidiphilum]|jgi:hypothetical protein|uniref:hypothetical protein n=1 Tax=Novosphingobium acidiphilum TaxID=505248 RepID=UPI000A075186|nr:hypothetical protein [Novosphingobium acidiphilum]
MSHARRAREIIAEIAKDMPANATLRDRESLLRERYPFGERKGWRYRVWLKAQRAYLAPFIGLNDAQHRRLIAREVKIGQPFLFADAVNKSTLKTALVDSRLVAGSSIVATAYVETTNGRAR